jgi:hypothetical protein
MNEDHLPARPDAVARARKLLADPGFPDYLTVRLTARDLMHLLV